ncbi:hypothetical protein J5N97_026305 [Dioscorea zingiberensis]|uniref:Large ribosomal subunit protein bL20c n=1 Tax=Dioscorea zingiberensis TaxID=325984 RepID=A0A9D5C1W2_9LILI|nr:hypothetical protein J5N97_026305 [Dioscorea zingiberensis]
MNKDKIFKLVKGFRGREKNCILWIEGINAGTRLHGVNYGNFMHGLLKENIQLNRKVLLELSMHEPYSFSLQGTCGHF